jgi:hypothetical protein
MTTQKKVVNTFSPQQAFSLGFFPFFFVLALFVRGEM